MCHWEYLHVSLFINEVINLYQVTINGVEHYTDYLNYVKIKESTGCYIQSSEEEAEAVVVNNILCSLPYKTENNDNPIAYIREIDSGELLKQLTDEKNNLLEELTATQMALTEIYERGFEHGTNILSADKKRKENT